MLQTGRASAEGAALYIDTTSSNVTDSVLGANIRLNTGTNNVRSVQFGLQYDTSKLQFLTSDGSGSPFTQLDASNGRSSVSVNAAGNNAKVTGDVPLIILKFRILSRSGSTSLSFLNPSIYNENYIEVSSTTSGATFDLSDATQPTGNSAPTITPTPPRTSPAAVPAAITPNRPRVASVPVMTSPPAHPDKPPVSEPVEVTETTSSQTNLPARTGSVFLRPEPKTSESTLPPAVRWLLAGWVCLSLVAILAIYSWRIKHALRNIISRKSTGRYESIPPLIILSQSNSDSSPDAIPFIPLAHQESDQSVPSEGQEYEWPMDLDSPMMNTL
jgi:hypothetical protein